MALLEKWMDLNKGDLGASKPGCQASGQGGCGSWQGGYNEAARESKEEGAPKGTGTTSMADKMS